MDEDEELPDLHAARRAKRREKELRGMRVTNRNLKALDSDRLEQRRENARKGHGKLTDAERRRHAS